VQFGAGRVRLLSAVWLWRSIALLGQHGRWHGATCSFTSSAASSLLASAWLSTARAFVHHHVLEPSMMIASAEVPSELSLACTW
jgi:hypothetical protein